MWESLRTEGPAVALATDLAKRPLQKSALRFDYSGRAGDQNGNLPLLFGTKIALGINVDIDRTMAKRGGVCFRP
jgi:hypothetical protein